MSRPVTTPDAPSPAGHYSQAVRAGDLLFVSGQLSIRPDGTPVQGSIEEQTVQALTNVRAIVEAAGGTLESIVKTTVYVTSIELWGRVDEAYAGFFGDHRPARAVIPSRDLHHGFLVEIEAVAEVPARGA